MEEPLLTLRRRLAPLGALFLVLTLQACAVAPQGAPERPPVPDPGSTAARQDAGAVPPGTAEAPLTATPAAASPLPPLPPPKPLPRDPAVHAEAGAAPPAMLDLTEKQDNLWDHIRNGFALRDLDDPLVRTHEDFYAARTDYLQRMFERCRPYLHYWVQEVDKRGMPTELALLPMIESACNPMALSRSKASGPWQFMAGTARKYGLQQDAWYDGRRDVVAATRAALDYLENLYDMFGTWFLALAAYNAGEGTVGRAVARNQAQGLPADYVNLNLPAETRNYVPKLQAIKNIVARPASFGVRLEAIPNEPHFTRVDAPPMLDLGEAARLAEIRFDELVSLNAGFNRPVVQSGRAELVLPADAAEVFLANLERKGARALWQTYTPRKGEALTAIAKRHGISVARLKEINDIPAKQRVSHGEPLLVPARSGTGVSLAEAPSRGRAAAPAAHAPAAAARVQVHVVKRGDTLFSIAQRYGATAEQLRKWNGLRGNAVSIGQRLAVREAAPPPAAAARPPSGVTIASVRRYVVRPGDTLYSIARQFKVSVDRIERTSSGALRPGDTVLVRVASAD